MDPHTASQADHLLCPITLSGHQVSAWAVEVAVVDLAQEAVERQQVVALQRAVPSTAAVHSRAVSMEMLKEADLPTEAVAPMSTEVVVTVVEVAAE